MLISKGLSDTYELPIYQGFECSRNGSHTKGYYFRLDDKRVICICADCYYISSRFIFPNREKGKGGALLSIFEADQYPGEGQFCDEKEHTRIAKFEDGRVTFRICSTCGLHETIEDQEIDF